MNYKVPIFEINGEIEESLNNIEKVIKDLNIRRDKSLSENLSAKINKHLQISHVYHSNAIEGNQLSLRETEIVLDTLSETNAKGKYETEALSLNKANDYLYDLINGKASLGKKSLLELHSLIMEGSNEEGGIFRSKEVQIKGSNHTPPPAINVESQIDNLFQWITRSSHDFSPIVMATILHHWLTWVHPFTDGNGRTTRMFFNFFLLQRGYPMIIVKLEDRDKYYDALIDADNGNIIKLLDLFIKKSRQTVAIYEEFLNDEQRAQEWKDKYRKLAEKNKKIEEVGKAEKDLQKIREVYQFDYEVWTRQVELFKTHLKEAIYSIDELLTDIVFELEEFDMVTFNQFLDILEGRTVTHNWYINLRIHSPKINRLVKIVFYFGMFKIREEVKLFGKPLLDEFGKQQIKQFGHPKLYVMAREHERNYDLDIDKIDLVNIGTWKDQLSFGMRNRHQVKTGRDYAPPILTVKDNPSKVVQNFVDQILNCYFFDK